MNQKKGIGLGYFNLARGLGMVLIVFGHTMNLYLTDASARTELFSGAGSVLGGGIMAAFFMISGFSFYKRSFKKCFTIQSKLLLRPYYWVAAAVLVTKLVLAIIEKRSFWEHGGELILTYLFGLNAEGGGDILGIPVESVSIFWFILALFVGWILYNEIASLRSERLRACWVLGCIIAGYGLTLISKIWLYCLPMGLMAVGYLAAGKFMKKHDLLEKKLAWKWWVLILAVVCFSATFGEVNIVACIWKCGLLDVAGSFCAGFLILRLYALLMRRVPQGKVMNGLEEIGFQSIWVVCFHAYEKIIFPWYRIAGALRSHPWLGVTLCFLGRCVVMYLMYKILFWCIAKMKKRKIQGVWNG